MNKPKTFPLMIALLICYAGYGVSCGNASSDPTDAWRLGAAAWCFKEYTFFEAVDRTAELGLPFIEAFQGQKIAPDIDAVMDASMPGDVVNRLKEKLNQKGITLTSIYIHRLPGEKNECRKVFEFCRQLNLETIVSEPEPEDLDTIEKLCDEFGINIAIHNHAEGLSRYWSPQEAMKVCEGRSARIGVCADTGHWQRSKLDPVEALKALEGRLISVHLKDLNAWEREAHDVPWGTGKGRIADVLAELHRQKVRPTLIAIEYEYNWTNNLPEIAQCIQYYKQIVRELRDESPLSVGWASVDITPEKPVALIGQLHKRISQSVLDPLTATVLALETRNRNGEREQAIMLSCDLLYSSKIVQERLQERLKKEIPDFDSQKFFMNATHTHTGPGYSDAAFKGLYDVSEDDGVMKASDYGDFFVERASEAAVKAWKNRKPGGFTWGLGHAVVGRNRRAHYFDGTTAMYGNTSREDFSNIEGYEDHDVNLLFFWTPENELTGIIVNIACTSQETEGLSDVSADFWHDARIEIRKRLGKDVFLFPQCSAAGDLSPHYLYNSRAEEIMRQRRGLSSRQEIARRIADAVEDVLPLSRDDIVRNPIFKHTISKISLPVHDETLVPFYETDPVNATEIHAVRLGDLAIASNPFELYLDYGIRIKAKSPALLTFLVQLSSQHSGYLPTEKAVRGGGYSADKFIVGPEGGQMLVNETVRLLQALWNE